MSQITTHVLDTARGKPAANVPICLYHLDDDHWEILACGTTNSDGRIADLLTDSVTLAEGTYRMHFDTKSYFAGHGEVGFYPYVDIVFEVAAGGEHYHIPLLLSAFGYSTYRGS